MINAKSKTAQLKNNKHGKMAGDFVGVKHAFGENFYMYEGKANESKYLGLVPESDLQNGVL